MSIISKEIDVRLNGYVVDYYEKLGYEIPRIRKNNKLVVQQDATITVKVSDLPESSNLNVDVQCDCTECNKIKSIYCLIMHTICINCSIFMITSNK